MNERIEELIEQADNIEILPDEEFCDTDFLADIDPRRLKKFAELIVRECINTLYQHGWTDAADDMKEHFGVEE